MNVINPANVDLVNNIIFQVLSADIIQPEWTIYQLYDFDQDERYAQSVLNNETTTVLGNHLVDIGFETFNPILNASSFFSLICIYFIALAATPLLTLIIFDFHHQDKLETRSGFLGKPRFWLCHSGILF